MKNSLFAATASLLMVSCSKEKVENSVQSTDKPVLVASVNHVFESNPPDAENYTYDEKGRLLIKEDDKLRISYSYATPGKIMVTQIKKPDNSAGQTSEATLDAQGRVVKIDYYTPAGVWNYGYEFTYDQEGFVKTEKGFGGSSSYENVYEIANGNVVSAKVYSNGVYESNRYYYYDDAIENKMPNSNVSLFPGKGLFGKTTKHLMTEYKNMDLSNTLLWHARYTYELNSAGLISKKFTNYVHQGTNAVTTYTYH